MTEIEILSIRCVFADWFYLRTGRLMICDEGEEAFGEFLKGRLIIVRYDKKDKKQT